jgi:hypothetical protein
MAVSQPETISCLVDHRVLLLGIDFLYRKSMEELEVAVLLPQLETVANVLGIPELDVPVEGYYINSPEGTRYFRLIRALQNVGEEFLPQMKELPEFQNIFEVVSSPIFGKPVWKGKLLPQGRDPLSQALLDTTGSQWEVERLVDFAYEAALETDDLSLVGLAARLKDPVVITALRESVILYAEKVMKGMMQLPRYEFIWKVDHDFARIANRFIEEFNSFLPDGLNEIPKAEPQNAERFYFASSKNEILGRCANLGSDNSSSERRYYHWAITKQKKELVLDDFWSQQLWTTERYRAEQQKIGWKFLKQNSAGR